MAIEMNRDEPQAPLGDTAPAAPDAKKKTPRRTTRRSTVGVKRAAKGATETSKTKVIAETAESTAAIESSAPARPPRSARRRSTRARVATPVQVVAEADASKSGPAPEPPITGADEREGRRSASPAVLPDQRVEYGVSTPFAREASDEALGSGSGSARDRGNEPPLSIGEVRATRAPRRQRRRRGRGGRDADAASQPAELEPLAGDTDGRHDDHDAEPVHQPSGLVAPRADRGSDDLEPQGRPPRPRRGRRGSAGLRTDAPAHGAAFLADDDESDVPITKEITRFVSAARPARPAGDTPVREMIINISGGDECRIAVQTDGRLEELFIERSSTESHVGNIYKGRVVNVEPSIQAVFVDFGLPKHGFLHISDVQPQYFPEKAQAEEVGRKTPRHHRPPIQRCFRRGQEVIVQITKEGVGTKGPTLTTYLSIPGQYLVMMPGMSRHGVSRKIEDEAVRREMRAVLEELKLPSGMGFILRTAGVGRSKRDLQRDLQYLTRLWRTVVERVQQSESPAELYRESDLVTRTIRDVYTADFSRIVVDDAATATKVLEFLQIALPRTKTVVELYLEREPIFHRFKIEDEIERINQRHVPLKSGGSLVIDTTEALVAIDVNSGRFRALEDAEETAFRINVEAAEEIARQLRLRDLGGLIVCDFIDMRSDRHKRAVEKSLKDALKKHKERARTLRMSAYGLIEMTRQRQGPSLKRNIYHDCPHCRGTGQVKMPESVMLHAMRLIQLAAHHVDVHTVTVTVASAVAFQLLNSKRSNLAAIEAETQKNIVVRAEAAYTTDQIDVTCFDARGQTVVVDALRPVVPENERRPRFAQKVRGVTEPTPGSDDELF